MNRSTIIGLPLSPETRCCMIIYNIGSSVILVSVVKFRRATMVDKCRYSLKRVRRDFSVPIRHLKLLTVLGCREFLSLCSSKSPPVSTAQRHYCVPLRHTYSCLIISFGESIIISDGFCFTNYFLSLHIIFVWFSIKRACITIICWYPTRLFFDRITLLIFQDADRGRFCVRFESDRYYKLHNISRVHNWIQL